MSQKSVPAQFLPIEAILKGTLVLRTTGVVISDFDTWYRSASPIPNIESFTPARIPTFGLGPLGRFVTQGAYHLLDNLQHPAREEIAWTVGHVMEQIALCAEGKKIDPLVFGVRIAALYCQLHTGINKDFKVFLEPKTPHLKSSEIFQFPQMDPSNEFLATLDQRFKDLMSSSNFSNYSLSIKDGPKGSDSSKSGTAKVTEPAKPKPADPKPVEQKPTDSKPTDSKPTDSKPVTPLSSPKAQSLSQQQQLSKVAKIVKGEIIVRSNPPGLMVSDLNPWLATLEIPVEKMTVEFEGDSDGMTGLGKFVAQGAMLALKSERDNASNSRTARAFGLLVQQAWLLSKGYSSEPEIIRSQLGFAFSKRPSLLNQLEIYSEPGKVHQVSSLVFETASSGPAKEQLQTELDSHAKQLALLEEGAKKIKSAHETFANQLQEHEKFSTATREMVTEVKRDHATLQTDNQGRIDKRFKDTIQKIQDLEKVLNLKTSAEKDFDEEQKSKHTSREAELVEKNSMLASQLAAEKSRVTELAKRLDRSEKSLAEQVNISEVSADRIERLEKIVEGLSNGTRAELNTPQIPNLISELVKAMVSSESVPADRFTALERRLNDFAKMQSDMAIRLLDLARAPSVASGLADFFIDGFGSGGSAVMTRGAPNQQEEDEILESREERIQKSRPSLIDKSILSTPFKPSTQRELEPFFAGTSPKPEASKSTRKFHRNSEEEYDQHNLSTFGVAELPGREFSDGDSEGAATRIVDRRKFSNSVPEDLFTDRVRSESDSLDLRKFGFFTVRRRFMEISQECDCHSEDVMTQVMHEILPKGLRMQIDLAKVKFDIAAFFSVLKSVWSGSRLKEALLYEAKTVQRGSLESIASYFQRISDYAENFQKDEYNSVASFISGFGDSDLLRKFRVESDTLDTIYSKAIANEFGASEVETDNEGRDSDQGLMNATKAARSQLDLRHVGFGSLTVCFAELVSMHPECSEMGKAAALYRVTPTVYKTAMSKTRDATKLRTDIEYLLSALEEAWLTSNHRQLLMEKANRAEQGNLEISDFWDQIDDYARNFSEKEFDPTRAFIDGLADRGLSKILRSDPQFAFDKGPGYVMGKLDEDKGRRIKLQILPRGVAPLKKPELAAAAQNVVRCGHCNIRGHQTKDCWWNQKK